MTRILSAFNLLKRVGFAILVFWGGVLAQPQAPVEWGEIRLLQEAPEQYYANEVYAHGDTLVLLAGYPTPTPRSAAACISPDNGQSWSPWHAFTNLDQPSGTYAAQVVFTSQGIYLMTMKRVGDQFHNGLYRTYDLGQTWLDPLGTRNSNLRAYAERNDTIFCASGYDSVIWTGDQGAHYSANRTVGLGFGANITDLATSAGWLHVIATASISQDHFQHLGYNRAPLLVGDFEEPQMLISSNRDWVDAPVVDFGEEGAGAILSSVLYPPHVFRPNAIWRFGSRDEGATWSQDTLTPFESAGFPNITHSRSGWLILWPDTTRQPGFSAGGFRHQYSANDGRSWYPDQQIEDDSSFGGNPNIYLSGDRIRVNTAGHYHNGEYGQYFFQLEGVVRLDTIEPVIQDARQLPDTAVGGTDVEFLVSAVDNDSLWQMAVVVHSANDRDSIVILLAESAESQYSGIWQIPLDTAEWHYYYRAEDMWKNVAYAPTEGPAQPWTVRIGPLAAWENALPPLVGENTLVAFPNPANGSVTIYGHFANTYEQTREVFVYDLLGREVHRLALPQSQAHSFAIPWDLTDAHGKALPSGSYLLSLRTPESARTFRLTIMK